MKVYLDACCLNRLTDDQTQLRVANEAEAVVQVLRRMREGAIQWVSSEVLIDEIDKNPSMERREANRALLPLASRVVEVNDGIVRRANELQSVGYGAFDAACAEAAAADVLLSTDDRFNRKASRGDGRPRVAVRNPLSWVQERLP